MDEIDSLSTIEDYLLNGVYPPSFSKNEKCSLRRRCRNNFKLEDGILMYQSRNRNSTSEETWRICVRTVKEKMRVLRSCHAGMEGGHLGRDKTIEKICSRFFWKNMTDDIKNYVKRCDSCQKMNARFTKSSAELHPIAVPPNVWKQVKFLS